MKIVVNGREYSSPDQLPPDEREAYERAMAALADKNGNGIPDILEMHLEPDSQNATLSGARPGTMSGASPFTMSCASPGTTVITGPKFVINGRSYDSVYEMSPKDRQHYEKIRSLLGNAARPPISIQLDPTNPAWWTPSGGLLATNPITVLFVAIVLTALVTCAVLALEGALR